MPVTRRDAVVNGTSYRLSCKASLPGQFHPALPVDPNAEPLQDEVDTRDTAGPMLDQKALGDCVVFAWLSMMMQLHMQDLMAPVENGGSGLSRDDALKLCWAYSALFLYYYSRAAEGTPATEDSGLEVETPGVVVEVMGVCLENIYDYSNYATKFMQEPPQAAIDEALNHKGLCRFGLHDTAAMMRSLSDGFSFVMGIPVYEAMESATDGIVPLPKPGDKMLGGHGVHVVGYIRLLAFPGLKFWIVKNSWGDGAGDCGYYYLQIGYPTYSAVTLRREVA